MDLQIQGHVAIVQGGSMGIGRGIAEALAHEGCDVVITARSLEPLSAAAQEISRQTGRRVVPLVADSADLTAIPQLVKQVESEFGRLDILVCNSGGPPAGNFLQLAADQWEAAANLLVTSPVVLLKDSLRLLEKSPAPRFFVVTSTTTRVPITGLTLSNVYRPAVVGLIKTLTEELAGIGLCCHSVAPGRFATTRLDHVIDMQAEKFGKTREEMVDSILASIPAGRLGQPIEMGHLVAWLSSPLSGYLRGGNWLLDGGLIRAI